jgi:hypothetical protein
VIAGIFLRPLLGFYAGRYYLLFSYIVLPLEHSLLASGRGIIGSAPPGSIVQARIVDQAECYADILTVMNNVIFTMALLTADEGNLLSVAHKLLTSPHRSAIRAQDAVHEYPWLSELKGKVIKERSRIRVSGTPFSITRPLLIRELFNSPTDLVSVNLTRRSALR